MTPETCPNCKVSLQGDPIPEKHREHYGTATHFSRVVGIYSMQRDRTTHWLCPGCGHTWGRT